MAQSSTIPPSNAEYGGDEVSALVLDPGYSNTRVGFAGEDVPKSVLPTHYGVTKEGNVFGDNSIFTPLPGISIKNPMAEDGTIDDWEAATKLWEYAITSRLMNPKTRNPLNNGLNDTNGLSTEEVDCYRLEDLEGVERPLEESPLLMSEPGWNTSKNREQSIEMAMESWGCPAFWLARTGVLAAFAAGKPTSLVIDLGASNTSVTPVHDGLVLRKGITHSPLAGNYISSQLRLLFSTTTPPIALTPHYLIASKMPVDASAPAQAIYRSFATGIEPDASFRRLQEERILTEFKEGVVQIWPGPGRLMGHTPAGALNEEMARAQPGRLFEMPDGYNQMYGAERYRVGEGLFDPKAALIAPGGQAPAANQTLPAIVAAAIAGVDVDVRPHLMANVVVTGGTSLTQGMTDRINQELVGLVPGVRVRISAPGNTYERKYASWIGGSILASLGTFHQMWISKKEYEEHGAGIVEKRCK